MTPRARPAPAQEGFILIEVLVSALILAIVAGAVLSLLVATTRSAATERTHSVAYGLAQEDQARLRTMRISSLNGLNSAAEPVTIDGTTYTVRSEGQFVGNKSGAETCNGTDSPADYVKISSTVSSPAMRNPVVLRGIVAPSTGSLDPSHGTLAFGVTNAAGAPLSNVSISVSGPASFTAKSDENGCANFADIPAGNYKVTTSAGGLINPKGETTTMKEYGVPAAGTQAVTTRYDQAGSLPVEFKYRLTSTGALQTATADSIMVFNSETGATATAYGSPGGTRGTSISVPNLFPFKEKYAAYAGSCESNNPNPTGTEPGNPAIASVNVPPGGAPTPTPVIVLPALNLKVTYNSAAVSGAKVTITDTKCPEPGTKVKRTYTTEANGQPSNSATGAAELGLPYGEYNVCASAFISNRYRRILSSSAVSVKNPNTATSLTLSLSGSSATESTNSSNQC